MRLLIDAVVEAYQADVDTCEAYDWHVQRMPAGGNGLIYKADKDDDLHKPLCVKISKRDDRQRTAREFTAMRALWWSGTRGISPYPLVFYDDIAHLPGDVVISEWIEGEVMSSYPAESDKQKWTALLSALARVHSLTPSKANIIVPDAVLCIKHPADIVPFIQERRQRLPETGSVGAVDDLRELDSFIEKMQQQLPMRWDKPAPQAFTQNDLNNRNMIWQHDRMRFVDWENSGWSDPAQDVADMLGREQGFDISEAHRAWICNKYADLVGDDSVIERIAVYEKMFTVFWLILLTVGMENANQSSNRIAGTFKYSSDYFAKRQPQYLKKVRAMFG